MKKIVTFFCLLTIICIQAQPVDPPADPDPPAAPINTNIVLMFFIALGFGYYVINNFKKAKKMKKTLLVITILFSSIINAQNYTIDASYGMSGVYAPSYFKPTNLNFGIGYNFDETFGIRLDVATDNFEYNESKNQGTKNLRFTLNGVANVLSLLNIDNRNQGFDLDSHLGLGYSNFKSNNALYNKVDNIANVVVGITPKYWITDNLALKSDFSTVFNLSQHYLFNGDLTYTGTPNGITGIYYNINLGLLYKI